MTRPSSYSPNECLHEVTEFHSNLYSMSRHDISTGNDIP